MNTQDFLSSSFSLPGWAEIFAKQKELKFLYEPEAKVLFQSFDIDCLDDQETFKKYCWRIAEELVEAEEARINEEKEHRREELIDALNFSIELMLLYGWTNKNLREAGDISRTEPYRLGSLGTPVYHLGLTANCLKNRQWRRSQYLVDLYIFERRFRLFLSAGYAQLLSVFGSDAEIRKAWMLKYKVNLFRLKTNY